MSSPEPGQQRAVRRPPADPEAISLVSLVSFLLRQRTTIIGVGLLLAAATATWVLLQPRKYTTRVAFIGEQRKGSSNLGGIAAQFGLTVPGTDATQSPAFYVDLVRSREILAAVVERPRPDSAAGARTTLMDLWKVEGDDPLVRRDGAIRRLRDAVGASFTQRTGLVTVSVTADSAALAAQIAQRLLDELHTFNLERRKSQATAERQFTERRLAEVRAELRAGEDALQSFLQRNRVYQNSPELSFRQERLSREVALRQEMYTNLASAWEQARIEEVRDTPLITVVEPAEAPVRPDSRRVVVKTGLAMFVGMFVGALLGLLRERLRSPSAASHDEYEEFDTLRREFVGDLRRPWRPIARAFGRSEPRGVPGGD